MAKKRRHKKRHNYHAILSMNPPEAGGGVLAGVKPKNLIGVVPVVGGVIANGMLTKFAAEKLPLGFVKKGLGNYALGLVGAGVIGAVGGRINPRVGHSMFIGAVVETLSRLVSDLSSQGMSALSLSNYPTDENLVMANGTMSGLSDFVTPMQIENARPIDSQAGQYPLPAPAVHHQAAQQQHYEAAVLSEMIMDQPDQRGMEFGI
jgi:hypothetical protein